MKMCVKCYRRRPLGEFKKARSTKDRRTSDCRSCRSEYERLRRKRPHARALHQKAAARWEASAKGIAAQLYSKHGYTRAAAEILAARIVNPSTGCAICGMPERWRQAKRRDGWKDRHFTHRLNVDHIDPGGPSTLANTRICCALCNSTRGAAERTDVEVLSRVRRWYERRGFTAADLWWLHTEPGRGGRRFLGESE